MGIVERLIEADKNSVQAANGNRIFGEAAERIKELEAELNEQVAAATEYVNALTYARCDLAALRQRIADAPVVLWATERFITDNISPDTRNAWLKQEGSRVAEYSVQLIKREDLL